MPKVIKLFLANDTANGLIKCTMFNWTGVVYKIPRNEIVHCKDRDDLNYSGVYFLIGDNLYIGKADSEGILYRLLENIRNDSHWNEALVCIMSDNSFGQVDVSYIAKKFRSLAVAAKRYTVNNDGDFSQSYITEERELDNFVESAGNIIATLGYKIFVPLDKPLAQMSGDFFDVLDAMTKCGITVNTKTDEWRIDGQLYYQGNHITRDVVKNFYFANRSPTSSSETFVDEDAPVEVEIDDNANSDTAFEMFGVMTTSNFGVDFTIRTKGQFVGRKDWRIDGHKLYKGKAVSKEMARKIFFERYNAAMNITPESETAVVDTITEEEALTIAETISNSAVEDIIAEILATVRRYGITLKGEQWYIDGKRDYNNILVTKAVAADIFLERYNAGYKINVKLPLLLYLRQKIRGTSSTVDAKCRMISDKKFVVLKDSRVSPYVTQNVNGKTIKKPRPASRYIADNILLKDMTFTKVNEAAEYVLGYSVSGGYVWKTEDGTLLKDIK